MRLRILLSVLLLACACSDEPDLIPPQQADFCKDIHRSDSVSLTSELAELQERMKSQTGVYVLEDGESAMISRAWLSEYAEKSIDIQYFIFSADNVGLIACDYLVRAADRGVKVRLLIDDLMVDARLEDVLTIASHPNIEIRVYNPGVNLGKNIVQKARKWIGDFKGANQRMHNKTFIVDNRIVITGGRNIADEYFDYDHEYNFRDRDVMMMGRTTTDVVVSFEKFWNSKSSVRADSLADPEKRVITNREEKFERLHQYACNPDNFWPQVREHVRQIPQLFRTLNAENKIVWNSAVSFVSDDPGKTKEKGNVVADSLGALVKAATTSIDIQSPYLIPTEDVLALFTAAVKRGVKVRILTNSLASTDNTEAFSGYQRIRKDLLATGVRIYEMKPDAEKRYRIMTGALQQKLNYAPVFGLHAKSMLIDGNTSVIGTFNLDPRSVNLNTECVTIVRSSEIAEGIKKEMDEEFMPQNAWETTSDFNPDSEAGKRKQIKAFTRRAIPKGIL